MSNQMLKKRDDKTKQREGGGGRLTGMVTELRIMCLGKRKKGEGSKIISICSQSLKSVKK